jgi:hypothetical protein
VGGVGDGITDVVGLLGDEDAEVKDNVMPCTFTDALLEACVDSEDVVEIIFTTVEAVEEDVNAAGNRRAPNRPGAFNATPSVPFM